MAVEQLAKQLAPEIYPGDRPKHILISQQFTKEWLEEDFFPLTKKMKEIANFGDANVLDSLKGKRIRGLFYESSTRTMESFESATELLGGRWSGLVNAGVFSSAVKGESTHDSTKIRNGYKYDCMVIRHNKTGGVEEAAEVSNVPVINAGDGEGQHPTQAALDVYTIFDELGSIGEQNIVFVGDLKYGRTVHSLAYLLAKFPGMRFDFVSPENKRMRPEILDHLEMETDVFFEEHDRLHDHLLERASVVYTTRDQTERHGKGIFAKVTGFVNSFLTSETAKEEQRKKFRIGTEALDRLNQKAIVMHPLPRLSELPREVDTDPRVAHFRQAENGLYARMALLHMILSPDRKLRIDK